MPWPTFARMLVLVLDLAAAMADVGYDECGHCNCCEWYTIDR